MRFLAAVVVIVASVTGSVWAQHSSSHGGISVRPAPPAHGAMRSPGPGRFSAPPLHGGMRGPGPGRFAAPPRSPVARTPYTGIRVPYAGNRPPQTGFGRLNATPGGRHTVFDAHQTRFGGSPGGGHSNWRDRDRHRDHDRDHRHHRMPYWPGYWPWYGYGISGWYLSPYVLGEPGTLAYGNWGSDWDYGGNQVPYGNNYGAPGPYGDYGMQGYGPDPGYQGSNYQSPRDSAPGDQASQPARQVYAPSSQPAQSAATIKPEEPVTLIFKDGRPPEQIHNYLLTSTKLTVLDAKFREIPLDQINMSATEEANRAAGIDFRAPHGSR